MSVDDSDTALQAMLRDGLNAELARINPETGLAQLHLRLRADAAHTPSPVLRPASRRDALLGWFTHWPTALASLVIVLQAGLLAWQAQPGQDGVAWRSTGVDALGSAATARLTMHFSPQAPVQAVGTLLHSLQAEIVAGPDAGGQWTLAVPVAQRDAVLARLRASPLVQDATAP